jgi:hypothetical protein
MDCENMSSYLCIQLLSISITFDAIDEQNKVLYNHYYYLLLLLLFKTVVSIKILKLKPQNLQKKLFEN